MQPLAYSHGQWVRKGRVEAGSFLREVTEKDGGNKRYSGTLEELAVLVERHFAAQEPGTGSVDGDTLLITVPTAGFFTNIVPITDENAHLLEVKWAARVEGELPVPKIIIRSTDRIPASVVKIVVYRADALARDAGRSTEAEWEMVAILADPAAQVPMDPGTMARNHFHEVGGTYREYTAEQWATAVSFWQKHATIEDPLPIEETQE
jgi:hypothetical protein